MKRHFLISLSLGMLAFGAMAQPGGPPPRNFTLPPATNAPKTDFSKIFSSDKERDSYAIGMMAASSIKAQCDRQEVDVDPQVMAKAFAAALTHGTTTITEEQEHEIINDLNTSLRSKFAEKRKKQQEQQAEEMRLKGEKNLTEGKDYLEKNRTAEGVQTLPSGLQYKVITEGTGPIPTASDEVVVKYKGALLDGTVFDDSEKHGGTATFHVNQVVPGWTQALEHMKVGSKWQIFVPSDLGYGPSGHGPQIGPNAVLIFEIELLSTKGAASAAIMPSPTAPVAVAAPAAPLTSDIIKVPSAEEMKKGAKIETIKAEDLDKIKNNPNPQ